MHGRGKRELRSSKRSAPASQGNASDADQAVPANKKKRALVVSNHDSEQALSPETPQKKRKTKENAPVPPPPNPPREPEIDTGSLSSLDLITQPQQLYAESQQPSRPEEAVCEDDLIIVEEEEDDDQDIRVHPIKGDPFESQDIFENANFGSVLMDAEADSDIRTTKNHSSQPSSLVAVKEEPFVGRSRYISEADDLNVEGFDSPPYIILSDDDDEDLIQVKKQASRATPRKYMFDDEDLRVDESFVNATAADAEDEIPLGDIDDMDDEELRPTVTQRDSLPAEQPSQRTHARSVLQVIESKKLELKSPDQMMADYEELDAKCHKLAAQVSETQQRLQSLFDSLPPQGQSLKDIWETHWGARLHTETDRLRSPMNDVIISVIGESGAGKSSLLNAVINDFVLPTHSSAGCTAAVTELCYKEGDYRVTVEFMDKQTFNSYRKMFFRQWKTDKAQKARDFIRAVWGDVDCPTTGKFELPTPSEFDSLLGTTQSSMYTDIESLRKCVSKYVDSTDTRSSEGYEVPSPRRLSSVLPPSKPVTRSTTASSAAAKGSSHQAPKHQPRIWPIVKLLKIEGPWKVLAGGVKLVDLPGSNDMNKARQEAAAQFMKNSKHLWIVSNIKRTATNETVANLLGMTRQAKSEALMMGLLTSACVIATHSDDVNEAEVIRNFGLDRSENWSKADLALLRNAHAKELIMHNFLEQGLLNLRGETGDDDSDSEVDEAPRTAPAAAGVPDSELGQLHDALAATPVFTVSALEYSRINRIEDPNSKPLLFQDAMDTEIPLLQNFIVQLGHDARQACLEGAHQQVTKTLADIKSHCQQLDKTAAAGAAETLAQLLSDTWPFFVDRVKSEIVRPMLDDLKSIRAPHIDDRLGDAVQVLLASMETRVASWRQKNFMSFKSTLKHGGCYTNASGVTIDLNEELVTESLRERIATGWNSYFNFKVKEVLQTGCLQVKNALDHYHNMMMIKLRGRLVDQYEDRIRTFVDLMDRDLLMALIRAAISLVEEVQSQQRAVVVGLRDAIAPKMEPCYSKAAAISGKGAFEKMIDVLLLFVRQAGPEIVAQMKARTTKALDEIHDVIVVRIGDAVADTLRKVKQQYDSLHKAPVRDSLRAARGRLQSALDQELKNYAADGPIASPPSSVPQHIC